MLSPEEIQKKIEQWEAARTQLISQVERSIADINGRIAFAKEMLAADEPKPEIHEVPPLKEKKAKA